MLFVKSQIPRVSSMWVAHVPEVFHRNKKGFLNLRLLAEITPVGVPRGGFELEYRFFGCHFRSRCKTSILRLLFIMATTISANRPNFIRTFPIFDFENLQKSGRPDFLEFEPVNITAFTCKVIFKTKISIFPDLFPAN